MLLYKIFIWGGLALAAILVVENMVTGMPAYVFIDDSSRGWVLSIVSIIVGFFIGYGVKGYFETDKGDVENYDF